MEALQFINEHMTALTGAYEFGQWSSAIVYPYFVGEKPSPEEYIAEDGSVETVLLVTGFHRGPMTDLLTVADRIKNHFDPINGLRSRTGSGAIAVFFDGSFPIPSGEADLNKIQINLRIKEWKGVQ